MPPNLNNDVLRQGCEKLGFNWQVIPRNVKGCWNLGYCGVGCPTNAKQGALLTTIPGALDNNARMYHGLRAEKLVMNQDRIDHPEPGAKGPDVEIPPRPPVPATPRHVALPAGASVRPALPVPRQVPARPH